MTTAAPSPWTTKPAPAPIPIAPIWKQTEMRLFVVDKIAHDGFFLLVGQAGGALKPCILQYRTQDAKKVWSAWRNAKMVAMK